MSDYRWYFRIWQDGMVVASGDAPDRRSMEREMNHYAFIYSQDGPLQKVEARASKNRWREHRPTPPIAPRAGE